ncbi:MAG TPA: nucleoside monophosphate kinase [Mycobacteriales bacterium]|nr:nucleoside monophosphate kinase [Mycobacteriales bacterium]
MSDSPIVVVTGRPGAGKGTQSELLAARLAVPVVDLGQRLRAESLKSTLFGEILARLPPGQYAPDEVAEAILIEGLREARQHSRGLILDGYPRFRWQVERLDGLLGSRRVDAVIHIDADIETCATRLQERVSCLVCGKTAPKNRSALTDLCAECGGELTRRADDNIAALRARLATYEVNMGEVLSTYTERGLLSRVDGVGSEAAVEARIAAAVSAGHELNESLQRGHVAQISLFGEI